MSDRHEGSEVAVVNGQGAAAPSAMRIWFNLVSITAGKPTELTDRCRKYCQWGAIGLQLLKKIYTVSVMTSYIDPSGTLQMIRWLGLGFGRNVHAQRHGQWIGIRKKEESPWWWDKLAMGHRPRGMTMRWPYMDWPWTVRPFAKIDGYRYMSKCVYRIIT